MRKTVKHADIAIVGAGVQAVTLMIALKRVLPALGEVVMIDPQGPMQNWFTSSNQQGGMDYMRTGWALHTDAGMPESLVRHTYRGSLPPTRQQWNEHASTMMRRHSIKDRHIQGEVRRIEPGKTSRASVQVEYYDVNGSSRHMKAKRVVVATGLGKPMVPGNMRTDRERVFHSSEVDLTTVNWNGMRVAVVGRGQSAATVAAYLADQGTSVTMVMRGSMGRDQLEADHEFLPGSGQMYRRFMRTRDIEERVETIASARKGRGVTPDIAERIDAHVRTGQIHQLQGIEVNAWNRHHRAIYLHGSLGGSQDSSGFGPFDRVVFCTGYGYDVTDISFLHPLMGDMLTAGRLPILHKNLSVPTASRVHFIGRGSELQTGPLGRNIPGAIESCRRVLTDLGIDGMENFHIGGDQRH